jgi:hypothetical protein
MAAAPQQRGRKHQDPDLKIKVRHLSVRMTPGLIKALKRTARKKALDPSALIRMLVAEHTDYDPDIDEPNAERDDA